jgi:PilZ domain
MIHQLRRLMPRQFADWQGTYVVEGDPEQRWRDCRVVDISSAGAGVELLDPPTQAAEGSQIFLAVHLRGEIRHTEPSRGNRLRIGAQFIDLTDAERDYLASLTEIQARW